MVNQSRFEVRTPRTCKIYCNFCLSGSAKPKITAVLTVVYIYFIQHKIELEYLKIIVVLSRIIWAIVGISFNRVSKIA